MAEVGPPQGPDHVHVDLAASTKGTGLAEEPGETDQVVGGVEGHWDGEGRGRVGRGRGL